MIDFVENQWRVPAERMKMKTPHIVPLSRQAIHTLEALKIISGHCALIFPNQNNHSKPMSNNTILKALELAGHKHKMRGRGFRAYLLPHYMNKALTINISNCN